MNLRTLFVLGRISNLPTVWSNLLVGWALGWGGLEAGALALLLAGGSLIYVGGMYLNDYCDAEFDARYCPQRPIPSGRISRRQTGALAAGWLAAGLACLVSFGWVVAAIALLLIALITLYDFRHKDVWWAPLIMGTCRFLLFPLGALAAQSPGLVLFFPVSAGIAMGLYVAGLTYLARGESRASKPARWALPLLLAPVALAWSEHWHESFSAVVLSLLLLSLLQVNWMIWMLVPFWRKSNPSLGRVVSGLLAGIVLADMLPLTLFMGPLAIVLFPLFLLALLLQRFVPAT